MIKYVAFLRGINVGGNKLIKMSDLRDVFERLRFKNVRTYIQSGNVIFETSAADAGQLVRKIERKILQAFGHEVTVILLTVEELTACVEDDPFKRVKSGEDVGLFVTFMSAEPLNEPRLPFVFVKENAEIVAIKNRAAFFVCRRKKNGMFSFPNAFLEKEFGVSATTRNWTTVHKMSELASNTQVV